MIEKEVLIYDINPTIIRKRLKKIGAKLLIKCKQKNRIFNTLKKADTKVLRVRQEKDKTTITYIWKLPPKGFVKQVGHYETEISNQKDFLKILKEFNFIEVGYMEKKIERYELSGIIFEIRWVPGIPAHLEIEADTIVKIKKGLKILGFSQSDCSNQSFYLEYNLTKKKKLAF